MDDRPGEQSILLHQDELLLSQICCQTSEDETNSVKYKHGKKWNSCMGDNIQTRGAGDQDRLEEYFVTATEEFPHLSAAAHRCALC